MIMNLIELKFDGELSPEVKNKIDMMITKRNERLATMKTKYLNGDYNKYFN